MPAPRFQATANIGEHQRFLPFPLGLCPRLQPFQLGLQIVFLPMPADPTIEHEQPPIEFAYHPFNFSARDADLAAHLDHLDTTSFDPPSNGDRMQTQLVRCCSNAQELLFPLCHQCWFTFLRLVARRPRARDAPRSPPPLASQTDYPGYTQRLPSRSKPGAPPRQAGRSSLHMDHP